LCALSQEVEVLLPRLPDLPITVALVFGGTSAAAELSVRSARLLLDQLQTAPWDVEAMPYHARARLAAQAEVGAR
jgi:hypothetical protein